MRREDTSHLWGCRMAFNPQPSDHSQACQSTNISEVWEFEVWLSWSLTGWQVWRLVGIQKSPGALPTVPADTRAHNLCSRDPNSLSKIQREALLWLFWDRSWFSEPTDLMPAHLPSLLSARCHLVPTGGGTAVTYATDKKTET